MDAFDEATARRKIDRLLGERRVLGTDVASSGVVWTFAAQQVADTWSDWREHQLP